MSELGGKGAKVLERIRHPRRRDGINGTGPAMGSAITFPAGEFENGFAEPIQDIKPGSVKEKEPKRVIPTAASGEEYADEATDPESVQPSGNGHEAQSGESGSFWKPFSRGFRFGGNGRKTNETNEPHEEGAHGSTPTPKPETGNKQEREKKSNHKQPGEEKGLYTLNPVKPISQSFPSGQELKSYKGIKNPRPWGSKYGWNESVQVFYPPVRVESEEFSPEKATQEKVRATVHYWHPISERTVAFELQKDARKTTLGVSELPDPDSVNPVAWAREALTGNPEPIFAHKSKITKKPTGDVQWTTVSPAVKPQQKSPQRGLENNPTTILTNGESAEWEPEPPVMAGRPEDLNNAASTNGDDLFTEFVENMTNTEPDEPESPVVESTNREEVDSNAKRQELFSIAFGDVDEELDEWVAFGEDTLLGKLGTEFKRYKESKRLIDLFYLADKILPEATDEQIEEAIEFSKFVTEYLAETSVQKEESESQAALDFARAGLISVLKEPLTRVQRAMRARGEKGNIRDEEVVQVADDTGVVEVAPEAQGELDLVGIAVGEFLEDIEKRRKDSSFDEDREWDKFLKENPEIIDRAFEFPEVFEHVLRLAKTAQGRETIVAEDGGAVAEDFHPSGEAGFTNGVIGKNGGGHNGNGTVHIDGEFAVVWEGTDGEAVGQRSAQNGESGHEAGAVGQNGIENLLLPDSGSDAMRIAFSDEVESLVEDESKPSFEDVEKVFLILHAKEWEVLVEQLEEAGLTDTRTLEVIRRCKKPENLMSGSKPLTDGVQKLLNSLKPETFDLLVEYLERQRHVIIDNKDGSYKRVEMTKSLEILNPGGSKHSIRRHAPLGQHLVQHIQEEIKRLSNIKRTIDEDEALSDLVMLWTSSRSVIDMIPAKVRDERIEQITQAIIARWKSWFPGRLRVDPEADSRFRAIARREVVFPEKRTKD